MQVFMHVGFIKILNGLPYKEEKQIKEDSSTISLSINNAVKSRKNVCFLMTLYHTVQGFIRTPTPSRAASESRRQFFLSKDVHSIDHMFFFFLNILKKYSSFVSGLT